MTSPTTITPVKIPPESIPIRTPMFSLSKCCFGEDSNRQGKREQVGRAAGSGSKSKIQKSEILPSVSSLLSPLFSRQAG